MEKRQLSENELEDKIREIYQLRYEDFSKTGEPKRILYGQIAGILNEEGILSYHDEDWTWPKVHSFIGKHPSIKEIV